MEHQRGLAGAPASKEQAARRTLSSLLEDLAADALATVADAASRVQRSAPRGSPKQEEASATIRLQPSLPDQPTLAVDRRGSRSRCRPCLTEVWPVV